LKDSTVFLVGERLVTALPDDAAAFHACAAELRTALERHCSGSELPAVLETSSTCPACHLRLGMEVRLPDIKSLRERIENAVAVMTEASCVSERRELLKERIATAPESLLPQLNWLSASDGVGTSTVVLTPEAADWIAQQLRLKVTARRNAQELVELLRGRQVTRDQAIRLFMQWFDQQTVLGENELISID
jgi:hypothetical protein